MACTYFQALFYRARKRERSIRAPIGALKAFEDYLQASQLISGDAR